MYVRYRKFLRNCFRLYYALSSPLVNALCTGASSSQLGRRVSTDAVVCPGDLQARFAFLLNLARLNRRPAPFSCFDHLASVILQRTVQMMIPPAWYKLRSGFTFLLCVALTH